jgi:hypothetical protein
LDTVYEVLFLEVVWSRIVSVSGFRDGVFGVCVAGDRVYAVGFDELHGLGRKRFRLGSYRSSDGTPIASWADEKSYPIASLISCTYVKGYIYAFGVTDKFWSILVFDRDLNLVKRVDIDKPYVTPFSAIVIDNNLYVVGTAVTGIDVNAVYVARISPDILSIEKTFVTDREGRGAGAYTITYNRVTDRIAIGGYDRVEGSMNWLVVFLTKDLDLIKIVRPSVKGAITGLSTNPEGAMYAVDRGNVIKLGKEGELLLTSTLIQGVKVYSSQIGTSSIGLNAVIALDNNVFYISNDDLSIIDSVRLSRGPQMLTTFVGSMDSDNDKVYLGLTQVVTKDDWNWVVVALRPRARRRFRLFGR